MGFDRYLGHIFGVIMMTMLACGCARLQPYHTVSDRAPTAGLVPGAESQSDCYRHQKDGGDISCVRFVEYDDFGNVFSRAQLDEAVREAHALAREGGIIVVYIHGWQHNAKSGDPDVESFHRAIQNAQKVDIKMGDKRKILGIYIGWRGKSLNIPWVNNLTFWERKTTAQSIGDGAVFELLRKLADSREEFPSSRLVLVGHSFGAAVMYSSVSHSIMDQIIDDPYVGSGGTPTRDREKRWDMVVLINPAFEAMQLRPHLELARSRQYMPNQLPHLILITSEADRATGAAFPAGRYFRSLFNKYYDAESGAMYRTAVGHYLPFVTHQLTVRHACSRFIAGLPVQPAADKLGTAVQATYFCFEDQNAMLSEQKEGQLAQPVMLTRCDGIGDCSRVADGHKMPAPPHMPILNIRASAEVMNGHNDIWNPTMQGFLVQLLVFIVEPPAAKVPPG